MADSVEQRSPQPLETSRAIPAVWSESPRDPLAQTPAGGVVGVERGSGSSGVRTTAGSVLFEWFPGR
jgi:hypothetical protein